MDEVGMATVSIEGDSQAVHLPEGFRLQGRQVQVRRTATGLILEQIPFDETEMKKIFVELATYRDVLFMPEGRQQPPMPPADEIDFDR